MHILFSVPRNFFYALLIGLFFLANQVFYTHHVWSASTGGTSLSQSNLIPRQALFGNPDKFGTKLSPDGKWISYIAPLKGVLNVWVAPRGQLDQARPLTHDTGRGIRTYDWTYTNQHIIYSQDQDGDENWVIHRVDVETGESLALTPEKGVHARLSKKSSSKKDEIIVSLNERVKEFHDLYRLNINTGEKTLVFENNTGYAGFIIDDSYQIRFAFQALPDGGGRYLSCVGPDEKNWTPFLMINPEDVMNTSLFGF